jgi:hypothetical protein
MEKFPPVDMSQIHPYAAKRIREFLRELRDEVDLKQLTDADLTADDKAKLEDYTNEILDWLGKCRNDAGEGTLTVFPFSNSVNYYMSNFRRLLKTVNERKLEKAQQEAAGKKRQIQLEADNKRREAALKVMAVPIHDAEKYLDVKEQQRFIDSTVGAVNAFMRMSPEAKAYNPEMWRLSPDAMDYSFWTGIISQRKNEVAQRMKAKHEYEHFVKELDISIKRIKEELSKEKKQNIDYPKIFEIYPPDSWSDLALPDEEETRAWARPLILARVPKVLLPVVSMVVTPRITVIPKAEYRFLGCPCLTWIFDICVAAQADLGLKASSMKKVFHGWEYPIQVPATKLGTMHLEYCLWESQEGVSTPLALLRLIVNKDTEEPGIKILTNNSERTEYEIDGYDEDFVEVRKGFIDFIRSSGNGQQLAHTLAENEIVDQDTADLLEAKWDLPLPLANDTGAGSKEGTGDEGDLVAALEAMGLKKAEIKEGIEAACLTLWMPLEEKIKSVLKNIGM